jgi:hypothetical protein
VVTQFTAIRFPEDSASQKSFQVVFGGDDQFDFDLPGVRFEGLLTLQAFGVGMDIAAVEVSHYLEPVFAQNPDGVDAAGAAADVQ